MPYNTPRPAHTCTRHPAGKRTCYARCQCRCRPCTDAATRWTTLCEAGHTARVPGHLMLAHISRLNKAGMTNPDIAHAAHISPATISNLTAGRTHSMNRAAATAILAVQPAPSRHGCIDATGTTRRLQALAAIGWDSAKLAPRIGVKPRRLERLRRGEKPAVHATTAAKIGQLYRHLSMTPATGWQADRARTIARNRGWAPPLAWDDGHGPHGIDNPTAAPHTTTVGPRETAIQRIAWLADGRQSLATITTQLGITEAAIERACRRAQRDDLWDRLNTRKAA